MHVATVNLYPTERARWIGGVYDPFDNTERVESMIA